MAETQQKRPREEETIEFDDSNSNSYSMRKKPYNNILSLLDDDDDEEDEDEEQNQGFSAIFSTLEQEISSPTAFVDAEEDQKTSAGSDEDESAKSVMRHLLEASDDELGIPNTEDYNSTNIGLVDNGLWELGFVDNGLWELEDVSANYYTMLQSELFGILWNE